MNSRVAKKHIWVVAMMMVVAQVVVAVPAKKGVVRTVALADGTQVELTLQGDEYAHWWRDASGNTYTIDGGGVASLLSKAEVNSMKAHRAGMMTERNKSRESRLKKLKAEQAKFTGKKRGIVILVNFQDLEMASATPQEDFDRMFNEEGYSDDGHIGSVADYFRDQSYGELDIEFDVAGPVVVSEGYAYYGENVRGNDKYPCTMVIEACRLVDEEIDFAQYDWDDDGEVDQVFVVYAGYGENASGVSSNAIWPHEWELSEGERSGDGEGAITLDNVKIDTYAVSCELSGSKGATLSGIGTACHEFSHCLGYPDFYDTSYSGGWGMEEWDLLDCGCYSGPGYNGEVPCGYTAYERWMAGWLEPIELTDGMEVSDVQPLNDAPEAYILYNDGHTDEYYILENRKSDRWFRYLISYTAPSGMLITHVDYSEREWENNTPNNVADHQRMTMFLANNEKGTYNTTYGYYSITRDQYMGHLYPYETNDSLTSLSTPEASLYNENLDGTLYMDKGIYDIALKDDGTMSFVCSTERPAKDTGDDPMGIREVESVAHGARRIYNLSGQYVGSDLEVLAKGIYVVDKQKIVKQ